MKALTMSSGLYLSLAKSIAASSSGVRSLSAVEVSIFFLLSSFERLQSTEEQSDVRKMSEKCSSLFHSNF